MVEKVSVVPVGLTLDDGTGREFEAKMKGSLGDGGNMEIVTRFDGKVEEPIAMVTFSVVVGQRMARAVSVVPVKHLIAIGKTLEEKYPQA